MEGALVTHFVGLDQGEGGALHRSGMAQATQDAARQRGFARAQIAMQVEDAAPPGQGGQTGAEGQHGLLAFGVQNHFRHGENSSSN
ncbi:hypothetical protein D3C71_1866360 [compost metagenome]